MVPRSRVLPLSWRQANTRECHRKTPRFRPYASIASRVACVNGHRLVSRSSRASERRSKPAAPKNLWIPLAFAFCLRNTTLVLHKRVLTALWAPSSTYSGLFERHVRDQPRPVTRLRPCSTGLNIDETVLLSLPPRLTVRENGAQLSTLERTRRHFFSYPERVVANS